MAELSKGLRQDAELIVGLCMSVEAGDTVTIITDNDHLTEADALAQIVVERGGFPVVMNNEYQVKKAIADMTFPMAPPKNLHQAMVIGRDHHHHQSRMGQPLRRCLGGARVVRCQCQDRIGRGGHRQLEHDRSRYSRRHQSRQGGHRGDEGRQVVPCHFSGRHRPSCFN